MWCGAAGAWHRVKCAGRTYAVQCCAQARVAGAVRAFEGHVTRLWWCRCGRAISDVDSMHVCMHVMRHVCACAPHSGLLLYRIAHYTTTHHHTPPHTTMYDTTTHHATPPRHATTPHDTTTHVRHHTTPPHMCDTTPHHHTHATHHDERTLLSACRLAPMRFSMTAHTSAPLRHA